MLTYAIATTSLCLILKVNLLVTASSPPITPEMQRRIKAEYCTELEEAEDKFITPGNLVDRLTRVRINMCNDPKYTRSDIITELYKDLDEKDYAEIRITWEGVEKYCKHVLNQHTLWRQSDFSPIEAKDVTDPEYLQYKQLCESSTTQPRDLVPAFLALRKMFVINVI